MKNLEQQEFTVWISKGKKVASFHPEEGFEEKRFDDHAHFMTFLQALSLNHYKFK